MNIYKGVGLFASGVCIGFLRVLAGQQLEASRAEQHAAGEQTYSLIDIHIAHLAFSGAGIR